MKEDNTPPDDTPDQHGEISQADAPPPSNLWSKMVRDWTGNRVGTDAARTPSIGIEEGHLPLSPPTLEKEYK